MQIEVKEIEPCKLSVHYEADASEILSKRAEVIGAFKKAPVPGFRPGKATPDAINMHYRQQIDDALKRALAEDAYHNTLFEKKIKPHGAPFFTAMLFIGGKFTCDFDLFTKPAFELASYQGLELPKPVETISVIDLSEKMMQELRVRFGETSPYGEDDFIQKGDNVIVDYEGLVDGVKIDSASAEGEMLNVGASPIKEFDDALLGMKVGETREFDVLVPENGLPSLAGKKVHFKVTVNMGSKTEPHPLDDTLAQKMNKKDFSELKEFVNASAAARIANNNKMAINEALSNKLADLNKVDVPNWMSLSEAKYLAYQAKLDWDKLEDADKERFLTLAKRNVTVSLVLDRVRELEPEAQLSDQEVFEIVKQNLAKSRTTASLDDVIKEMNRTGYLQILFSRIRDEYTLDFVSKSVRIIE
jgi:trigger factor